MKTALRLAFALSALGCGAPETQVAQDSSTPPPASAVSLAPEVSVTRAAGGSIVSAIAVRYSMRVDETRTMKRDWITIHDARLPVDLRGTVGVQPAYDGSLILKSDVKLAAKEPLAIVEVRFVLFDVYGEYMKTLSASELVDWARVSEYSFQPEWSITSESDVSTLGTSIAYVSRVRTRAGRVYMADLSAVVAEARKISDRFSAEQLDSKD